MKTSKSFLGPITLAVITAGYLAIPTTIKAADSGDSAAVSQLLAEAKTEAVQLTTDSSDMQSFIGTTASWKSYANKLDMIKDHVDQAGKLLAKLKAAETTGSAWQESATRRIEPFLMEMADNTVATIQTLNANQGTVHMPKFQDFVKANYQLATDLEALIRDFVNYGNAKGKFERLSSKLEAGR